MLPGNKKERNLTEKKSTMSDHVLEKIFYLSKEVKYYMRGRELAHMEKS